MNVTFNSVAFIAPPTYKSLSTVKSPSIDDEVLTTNPKFGEIDAVAEPDAINVLTNASGVNAVLGISNSLAPLPLNEPLVNWISPKKVEPLTCEFTTNPSIGSTDAVTLPVANLEASIDCNAVIADCASSDNAVSGISNNNAPLPLNEEPLSTLTSPKKVEPISVEVTTNPSTGEVDAVTLPLAINADKSASSVSAVFGISNRLAPLPLNDEPLSTLTSPKNVEPLSIEVTMNPSIG